MPLILVDHDLVADVRHRVQPRDVLVREPYAPVRDAAAQLRDGLRSVQRVAVAEVEAVVAEDVGELTLARADRRDHDRAAADDQLALRKRIAVGLDLVAAHGEIAELLAAREMHDAQAVLAGLLDEMPVRRHPHRMLFLRLDAEAPDRRAEDHGLAAGAQRRALAPRADRLDTQLSG